LRERYTAFLTQKPNRPAPDTAIRAALMRSIERAWRDHNHKIHERFSAAPSTKRIKAMRTLYDNVSPFVIAAVCAAPADTPISSPDGNGADPKPPPISESKRGGKTKLEIVSPAASEAASPPADLQPPPIQPADKPFTIDDCFADMSQPPPVPPQKYSVLRHSGSLPKAAFRVLPREGDGVFLTMISLPFGEAEPGQSFNYPIVNLLRESVERECPTLIVKRFEIRVAIDAAGKPSLIEVPADPLKNAVGESNRRSLLFTIELAESRSIIANKITGGSWSWIEAGEAFEPTGLVQTQRELTKSTYAPDFITDMDQMVLRRFRGKTR
jgi:hypothetical protein